MYHILHNTLHRQSVALELLQTLLLEEYQCLLQRDTAAVVALEFSIHELIRQLAKEKSFIVSTLNGGKILDYADLIAQEQGDILRSLYAIIDDREQSSSRQASINAELSLVLLDQSQRTMQELHNHVAPPSSKTYGRSGAMGTQRPQASYISGRL